MNQTFRRIEVEEHRPDVTHSVYGESAEQMDQLEGESVHLVVTSPPYWNIKDYGNNGQIGFTDSFNEYINRLNQVWQECYRVLNPGCRLVVNIGDQYHRSTDEKPYRITPLNAEIVHGIRGTLDPTPIFLGNIIWQKVTNTETSGGASVMGSFGRPRNGYVSFDYEYISIFKKPGSDPGVPDPVKEIDSIDTPEWKTLFDGHWQIPGAKQQDHPAPFPEEIPRRLIRMFTFSGDTVLDPFLGQGTTMRVADLMDRSSVGFEIGFESPSGSDWREVVRDYVVEGRDPGRFSFHW